jgi:cytochrome bd ubiquinol oxidase subunit I
LLVVMVILMLKIIKAGPQDHLFAATDEGEDADFVVAALPATPANKELGS